jgi:aromatic-L-amino-acid decarboxylase
MPTTQNVQPHLDPEDWDAFRTASHRALDGMIDHLMGVRDRKVWQQAPASVREHFRANLPEVPQALDDVLDDFENLIKPYATGNTHPLFMGWVHGAGTPVGMLAEMLAAGLNANCGGRNHIGIDVEKQIALWAAQAFGFPEDASGIFVTGTSVANLIAILIARSTATIGGLEDHGLHSHPSQLVAYTSAQAHGCITRAIEVAGVGARYLRLIPADSGGRMQIEDLRKAIADDRARGLQPFVVVGTAGTVDTGAIDDLNAIADTCKNEGTWFHVDGAFGALCALAPNLRTLIGGIERADSIAFDFHKWAHVPYDAGFVLVRDPAAHRRGFGSSEAYLRRSPSGLAAGEIWPCDLGVDLSRGFRALKTWFTFRVFGSEKIGECIENTCRLAQYLEKRLIETDLFEMRAPVTLNIVCFGLKVSFDGALNELIVCELHDRGVAAPSTTEIGGRKVIRAAIVNHRTHQADIDVFVEALKSAALKVLVRHRLANSNERAPVAAFEDYAINNS